MAITALLLSRLQFAFTISFHIIFPSFTIGLAAWLTILEALHLATDRPAYRVVFEFWLKIFGVAFGLGVVSGIVMAFQFGTNWDVLARKTGPIQGVLLSYETFTAFFLEASFFGILVFGRPRVPPWFYLFSTAMVALGTTLSAFWIRPHRLVKDHFQSGFMGAFSPYAVSLVHHRCLLRCRDGRVVLAAREIPRRSPHYAAHGARSRCGSRASPAVFRALKWGICSSAPTIEDGRDRGPVAR
jgi:hypothetical protein